MYPCFVILKCLSLKILFLLNDFNSILINYKNTKMKNHKNHYIINKLIVLNKSSGPEQDNWSIRNWIWKELDYKPHLLLLRLSIRTILTKIAVKFPSKLRSTSSLTITNFLKKSPTVTINGHHWCHHWCRQRSPLWC